MSIEALAVLVGYYPLARKVASIDFRVWYKNMKDPCLEERIAKKNS